MDAPAKACGRTIPSWDEGGAPVLHEEDSPFVRAVFVIQALDYKNQTLDCGNTTLVWTNHGCDWKNGHGGRMTVGRAPERKAVRPRKRLRPQKRQLP